MGNGAFAEVRKCCAMKNISAFRRSFLQRNNPTNPASEPAGLRLFRVGDGRGAQSWTLTGRGLRESIAGFYDYCGQRLCRRERGDLARLAIAASSLRFSKIHPRKTQLDFWLQSVDFDATRQCRQPSLSQQPRLRFRLHQCLAFRTWHGRFRYATAPPLSATLCLLGSRVAALSS